MYSSLLLNSRKFHHRAIRTLIRIHKRFFSKVHQSPIFILGNQKSGTSVFALLLADLAGKSVTVDLRKEVSQPTFMNISDEGSFDTFIHKNKSDFSNKIIKEPNLSLFYPELFTTFPLAKFVYVVREPKDNIRSILNRLDLVGNTLLTAGDIEETIPVAWRYVINNDWKLDTTNSSMSYVEQLAHRWNHLAEMYSKNSDNIILIRYEDFCSDKKRCIREVSEQLGWSEKRDISQFLDRQFQTKGNANVDLNEFYGENFELINTICKDSMTKLGYNN